MSIAGTYNRTLWASGFDRLLGVSLDASSTSLFGVGRYNATDVVIAFDMTIPQRYKVTISLTDSCTDSHKWHRGSHEHPQSMPINN
jgi:hypothetical protein